MSHFTIHCASASDGSDYTVVVDAPSADAARDWALEQGHLVGKVTAGNAQAGAGPMPASPAASPELLAAHSRQSMIDSARAWQRAHEASGGASGGGSAEMRRIADALERVASSALVAKPRRTMILCVAAGVMLALSVSMVMNLALTWALSRATGNVSIPGIAGLTGGGAGGTIDPSQLPQLMQGVNQYGNLLKEVSEDPLGNKK